MSVLSIVYIVVGLGLILLGANALTDGASALARRFGLSDLIVGLTVVAFGTSTPELVISAISAAQGNPGMAIGNVVGSNIFNILAIIGVTALLHPVKVERTVMTREIPMVVISAFVLLVLGNAALLDAVPQSVVTRTSGVLLLLLFAIFMWYTMASARAVAGPDEPAEAQGAAQPVMPLWRSVVWVVMGLAMLVYGGDRFVAGASDVASALGVSDAIVGLTIAAVGTSLPELAASVVAALKGNTAMAVGNVIGSCIFNVFMVLGLAGVIAPLPFAGIDNLDLLTLMGASLMFLAFGWLFGKRTFTRAEGWVMVACYICYIALKVSQA